MATNFPTSLDSLTNPATSDQLSNPSHAAQHANANDAIEQLQAKVGINGSTVTTSHDYKIAQLEAAITAGVSGTKLIYQDVRNQSGASIAKGTPVRVTGSDGASGKLLIGIASNASESGSSKTFGLTSSAISNNSNGEVVTNGLLENVDTTGAVDGDPVWLGVNGAKIFGLVNKPVAPAHLVYLGVVVRGGQQNTGSIFVSIQNGFEVEELHNVLVNNTTLQNKDALIYDSTTQLWKNYDLTQDFVSSSDVQNSLGDYIPLTSLGEPQGPAKLDVDGNLLIPENKIIIEGATANDYELTIEAPDVTSDITITLPNVSGTIATTSDISTAISNLIDSAPVALDTLNELAAALGDDPNYATTITTALGDKLSKSGGDTITTSSASVKGLIVKGSASQTANLTEWQNSSGTVLTYVTPTGHITATSSAISTLYTGGQLSTGTLGYLNATTFNPAVRPVVVRGAASQTANLTEWQDSSGTVLAGIDQNGRMFAQGKSGNTNDLLYLRRADNNVSFYVDKDAELRGNFSIRLNQNPPIDTQAFFWSGTGSRSALGVSGTSSTNPTFYVKALNSQTSNLTEWQNSAGTVLAKVDASGAMFATTAAVGTDTTQVATTAFVIDQIDASTQPGSLYQADAPTSPATGQIWVESDSYSDSFDPNIIRRHTFTATAGQTNFIASVTFVDGYEQVYFNGLLLLRTTDYTTSGSNTVILATAAAAGDIVEIVTVTNLNSVNTYTQAEIDSKIATEVNNLVASAPSALNTLDELAAALGDDANFASTVTNSLAGKKNEASSSISANTNLVAGTRYFVASASSLTLTLPSTPSVNDQIDIFDASGNASTYNITVARNGKLINGNAGNFIIDVNGSWYTLVFTGNTYGWKVA